MHISLNVFVSLFLFLPRKFIYFGSHIQTRSQTGVILTGYRFQRGEVNLVAKKIQLFLKQIRAR